MRAALCTECEWVRQFPRATTAVATAALEHRAETDHTTREAMIFPRGRESFEIRLEEDGHGNG